MFGVCSYFLNRKLNKVNRQQYTATKTTTTTKTRKKTEKKIPSNQNGKSIQFDLCRVLSKKISV